MNKIKENILDVLLRKKTDPIYSDMVEDLKNKGYTIGNVDKCTMR